MFVSHTCRAMHT